VVDDLSAEASGAVDGEDIEGTLDEFRRFLDTVDPTAFTDPEA
jgi:hypothetical protein